MTSQLHIVDSHTGGEPTRTIIAGGPDLGGGSMQQRLQVFKSNFDSLRRSLIHEPRGSTVMVGALLCEPVNPNNTAAVIFFNNAGFLGMCGHGMIGIATTLCHLKKIKLGKHRVETPVGTVTVNLLTPNKAEIENVASYRFAKQVKVNVEGIGEVVGDIAWGGNWFFLIKNHGQQLIKENCQQLLNYTSKIQQALEANKIFGNDSAIIDHVELFSDDVDKAIADSKNFVLCPGHEYDRSPCGTGTSAKMACLFADGELREGEVWRQQSIIGSIFEGNVQLRDNQLIPIISGEAFVTLESNVISDKLDPFRFGI